MFTESLRYMKDKNGKVRYTVHQRRDPLPYLWVKCLPILSLSARNGYIQKVRRRLTTVPDTQLELNRYKMYIRLTSW